jgi:hypothetical protein
MTTNSSMMVNPLWSLCNLFMFILNLCFWSLHTYVFYFLLKSSRVTTTRSSWLTVTVIC